MGRMLGSFDNPQELDRPDLNKCPDCECFFEGETCPLCGKVCPEEMRAGNRKPPKKERHHRPSSGRVTFIEWYHSWWFITLTMFFMPIVGIVLLITSPHKNSAKITFIIIGVAYLLISTVGIGTVIGAIGNIFDPPVNTSLSREEYTARCEIVSTEDFYRFNDSFTDKYISLELVVEKIFTDIDSYGFTQKNTVYYVCRDTGKGEFNIIVRNCIQDGTKNLAPGDHVTAYGEGAGIRTVYDMEGIPHTAPCINIAYVTVNSIQK